MVQGTYLTGGGSTVVRKGLIILHPRVFRAVLVLSGSIH